MSKILIDVDDDLLAKAQSLFGGNITKEDAVNRALTFIVRSRSQLEILDWLHRTDPLGDLTDPEVRSQARK